MPQCRFDRHMTVFKATLGQTVVSPLGMQEGWTDDGRTTATAGRLSFRPAERSNCASQAGTSGNRECAFVCSKSSNSKQKRGGKPCSIKYSNRLLVRDVGVFSHNYTTVLGSTYASSIGSMLPHEEVFSQDLVTSLLFTSSS